MNKQINGWNLVIEQSLLDYIDNEYATKQISPAKEKIFHALELTSFEQVKVVIFGQDPYPTKGVATGLAFSSSNTLPASLRNLFTELESDLGIKRVNTDLDDWAKRGVLLLNTALTVEVGNAGSHSKIGWIEVTNQVIAQIGLKPTPVVFVLLGKHAQNLEKYISSKDIVLKYTHPSPLSAYRGFWGCKMFSTINLELKNIGQKEIDFSD